MTGWAKRHVMSPREVFDLKLTYDGFCSDAVTKRRKIRKFAVAIFFAFPRPLLSAVDHKMSAEK